MGWSGRGQKRRGSRGFLSWIWTLRDTKIYITILKRLYSETAISLRLKRGLCTLWAGSNWEPLSSNERMSGTWEKGREGQLGGSKQPLLTLSPSCSHHSQKESPCSKLDFESFTRQFGNYLLWLHHVLLGFLPLIPSLLLEFWLPYIEFFSLEDSGKYKAHYISCDVFVLGLVWTTVGGYSGIAHKTSS